MDIYFIIVIILILIIIYVHNEFNIKKIEPFCTKKSNDKCLNKFTYSKVLPDSRALIIQNNSVTPINTNFN